MKNAEFYSKWLILPALLGAAVFIAQVVTDRVDLEAAPVFSVLIALWGAFLFCLFENHDIHDTYTIHTRYGRDCVCDCDYVAGSVFLDYWKREEAECRARWGMTAFKEKVHTHQQTTNRAQQAQQHTQ